ncbi:acyl carrier protein [Streptomyces sp. NTH33]|uniref:acyl carrier protein n=1 Tax=Streptomyces sp. NTH33 TaxID=1735453 RepID=UPI000DA9DEFB|nr:acyl carrier protein [Streptomyces sp. NTH33]PZH06854.1 acyl carrier protein [Streptomyces sp. NTH33]
MTTGTTPADAILHRVSELLEEKLGLLPEEITPQARFKEDLGLDSLDMVELLTIMESESGQPVDDDAMPGLTTVGDVVGYLVAHGNGAQR